MKSIWKGSVSFGLVNIPIKMYSGSQSNTLDLEMLRKRDFSKVKYKRVSADDGQEIPYEEIVKGYKHSTGYVVLTDKDFESANVEKTHSIDLINFVKEEEIDSIYYEKAYYLEPEKTGTKSYSLLREAINKSGMVGVGRFVLKNREHMCVIRTYKDVLIANQIRFQDEIRSYSDLTIPKNGDVNKKELDMAITLIKHLIGKFNPKEYKDTYNDELKKIIELKAKGKKVKPVGKAPKATNVKNLMTLLKKSIDKKAA